MGFQLSKFIYDRGGIVRNEDGQHHRCHNTARLMVAKAK
jgi:hypothetical protein